LELNSPRPHGVHGPDNADLALGDQRVEHLMQKLDTHSLAGLTKFAIRAGVTLLQE
jgi:hypothetical protein